MNLSIALGLLLLSTAVCIAAQPKGTFKETVRIIGLYNYLAIMIFGYGITAYMLYLEWYWFISITSVVSMVMMIASIFWIKKYIINN
jgi:hypothetical protein